MRISIIKIIRVDDDIVCRLGVYCFSVLSVYRILNNWQNIFVVLSFVKYFFIRGWNGGHLIYCPLVYYVERFEVCVLTRITFQVSSNNLKRIPK